MKKGMTEAGKMRKT